MAIIQDKNKGKKQSKTIMTRLHSTIETSFWPVIPTQVPQIEGQCSTDTLQTSKEDCTDLVNVLAKTPSTSTNACANTNTNTCMYTNTYTNTCMYTNTCICTCSYTRTQGPGASM